MAYEAGEFAAFLRWLDPNPEKAGKRYNEIKNRLTIFFARRHKGDVLALSDVVIDRMVRKAADSGYIVEQAPEALAYSIAHYVALESSRCPITISLGTEEIPSGNTSDDQKALQISKEACLDECLNLQPLAAQDLLRAYYPGSQPGETEKLRGSLASSLGLSANTLRQRVFAIKRNLLNCFLECMRRTLN